MADRSLSWIDPERWSKLLDKAGLGPPDDRPRPGGAGGTGQGAGTGSGEGAERPSRRPVPGMGRPSAVPETAALDSLLDRARALPGVEGAFVCDGAGLTLAASRVEASELAVIPGLMKLLAGRHRGAVRGGDPGAEGGEDRGALVLPLGGSRRLHLIDAGGGSRPAGEPRGGDRHALGVVADRPLPDATVSALRRELERTRKTVVEGTLGPLEGSR